jgi:hypothetical protein
VTNGDELFIVPSAEAKEWQRQNELIQEKLDAGVAAFQYSENPTDDEKNWR